MFRGPPGLFREQEHCSWVGRSFEAIFLPLLSQFFLASQQQVFKVVSQVSGEEHSRQEWEGSEHAISGRASALWLLPRLASGLLLDPYVFGYQTAVWKNLIFHHLVLYGLKPIAIPARLRTSVLAADASSKCCFSGSSYCGSGVTTQLVSKQVQSLASISGLRIQPWAVVWIRSCSSISTPASELPYAAPAAPKKRLKKKKPNQNNNNNKKQNQKSYCFSGSQPAYPWWHPPSHQVSSEV